MAQRRLTMDDVDVDQNAPGIHTGTSEGLKSSRMKHELQQSIQSTREIVQRFDDTWQPPSTYLPNLSMATSHQDAIHEAVWRVARLFGFQTFNSHVVVEGNPHKWTPASAFVAGDHIQALLNDGMLRRSIEAQL